MDDPHNLLPPAIPKPWLVDGGEMGARIRAFDWTQTPLGAMAGWPQSLRSALNIMLSSKAQIVVVWGPEQIMFYNDCYIEVLGDKHPRALGSPVYDAWSELWQDGLKELFSGVTDSGKTFAARDWPFIVRRFGFPEETTFDISMAPLNDEAGEIGGLFCIVTETTRRVIGERWLKTLGALSLPQPAQSVDQACAVIMGSLASNPHDLPFALLYLVDPDGLTARLAGSAGLPADSLAAPITVDMADSGAWPLGAALRAQAPVTVADVGAGFGVLANPVWPEPTNTAVVLAITHPRPTFPAGFLVLGLSPRRPLDTPYRDFLDLVATQVVAAIDGAQACEEMRKRDEEVLHASKERLRTLFDLGPVAIYACDLAGTLVEFNRRAVELWGREPKAGTSEERYCGSHRMYLQDGTAVLPADSSMAAVLTGRLESVCDAEMLIERPDGSRVSVVVNVVPLKNTRGETTGALQCFYDITERKRSERALQQRTDQLAILFDSAPVGAFMLDGELRICGVNPAGMPAFGNMPEVIGRAFEPTMRLMWPEPQANELIRMFRHTLTTGEASGSSEYRLDRLGLGTAEFYECHVNRIPMPEGGFGVVCHYRDISSDVAARNVLAESESRYRSLFASAPMAVFACDLNGVIQEYNARAAELWGREPVLGVERYCGSVKLWLPDGTLLPHDQSPMVEVMRTGDPANYIEVFIERIDGSRLPVLVNFAALRDAHGVITGSITSFVDMTERKRTETALSRRTAQFDALLHEAPLGIFMLDADLRIQEINPAGRPLFDLSETPVGRDFEALMRTMVTPAMADEIVGKFREVLATGVPYFNPETTAKRLDRGVVESYEWRISRIPLPEGRFGVVCYFWDISERVKARKTILESEEQLRGSEVRYRRLFETSQDGILILDAESAQITDANPYITRLLGYAHSDLVGRELWQIGLFKDIEESKAAMRELQEKRFIRYENLPLKTKSGERIELEFVSNVYREGKQRVIQCNVRDITYRKQLELETSTFSANLLESDQRKNEFIAMLAHELRNPLAPIRNALQIMRLTAGDERAVQASVVMMERQVGQMVRLVDDLLDASRVSRGKIVLRRERVELSLAIGNAIEAARPLADSLRHHIEVTVPPEPVWLSADPTRLAQVIGNLLNNACKFTEPGGHIAVTVERDGGQASIRMTDNGVGIAADQLPHIFEMFMQADTSLGRSVSGLGIGLTLVKNLVEIHGGTVSVRSGGIGQGSEFVVHLPILADALAPLPAASAEEEPEGLRARRILVVDDNRDAATSLAMLLDLSGYETRTAFDGVEAVQAAATFRPEVVLLDIGLPKLNGYEVARAIRKQPWGGTMALVALTGWGQDEDRHKSTAAGFDRHMVKPVDFEALTKVLAELSAEAVAG